MKMTPFNIYSVYVQYFNYVQRFKYFRVQIKDCVQKSVKAFLTYLLA